LSLSTFRFTVVPRSARKRHHHIRELGSARRLRGNQAPLDEESACTDRPITLERNKVSPRERSMTRSRFLHVAAAAVGILAAPVAASGPAYPPPRIHVIV